MLRLNLGCGDDYREGFVNIDLRDDCGADEVGDATKLRFADGEADEILALDFLEHHPAFRTQDILLEWRRVLRPGGRLVVKVPNLLALAEWIVAGKAPRLIIRNMMGGHRWGPDGAWDAHHHGFVPETLREDLTLAGFRVVREDHSLNMTFEAEVA